MKTDYNKLMLERLSAAQTPPSLLLHSCCAPCSSHCLSVLAPLAKVTVLYFNPNIFPVEEYEKRKSEQMRFIKEAYPQVKVCDCDYDHTLFLAAVKGLEGEKEGGARCTECFRLRLTAAAQAAKTLGCDMFATTLTVSPHKNASLINETGREIQAREGVDFLPSDFKKKEGYKHSILLSRRYSLYRQNYCGCEFSLAKDNVQE